MSQFIGPLRFSPTRYRIVSEIVFFFLNSERCRVQQLAFRKIILADNCSNRNPSLRQCQVIFLHSPCTSNYTYTACVCMQIAFPLCIRSSEYFLSFHMYVLRQCILRLCVCSFFCSFVFTGAKNRRN